MNFDKATTLAIKNIAAHGDTDIFPLPFECHVFYDRTEECSELLKELHKKFDTWIAQYPPETIVTLSQVGYTGFRWATQIEPFWNAYYLALVLQVAEKIEAKRIQEDKARVFSYRFGYNEESSTLFKEITWRDYRRRCLELSKKYEYVVVTDIADFYPRVYHHRLENGLCRLPDSGDYHKKIIRLLSEFSKNVSYGLPIGGPASRILAELALSSVDRLLDTHGIEFCRYADDYCLFCSTTSAAYKNLVFLSEKLFNEGLVLQKKKTRILNAQEYMDSVEPFVSSPSDPTSTDKQKLLNISVRFDPYSPTAVEDYEAIKLAVNEIDIIGILAREVTKSAIDQTISKQAINAIKALDPNRQGLALRIIIDINNLEVLSPAFITILRLIRSTYESLLDQDKDFVDNALVTLYRKNFSLLSVELNMSYYIQVMSLRWSHPKEEILTEIFKNATNPLIRRLIILAFSKWDCHEMLSDIKFRYAGLSSWEKRSFIIASYKLGDEGQHWRKAIKQTWNPMELLIRDWFSNRYQSNKTIPI